MSDAELMCRQIRWWGISNLLSWADGKSNGTSPIAFVTGLLRVCLNFMLKTPQIGKFQSGEIQL